MEETRTDEEIQQSISAALDSVGLIKGIIEGTQMADAEDSEKEDTVERNVGHLNIMSDHDWFVSGSTDAQTADITDAVTSGSAYIA